MYDIYLLLCVSIAIAIALHQRTYVFHTSVPPYVRHPLRTEGQHTAIITGGEGVLLMEVGNTGDGNSW